MTLGTTAKAEGRYAEHSVLREGNWAKIRVPESGFYQLSDALIKKAGFSNPSRVKIYGYGGALQPEKLTGDYLTATDDLKEVPTCMVVKVSLWAAYSSMQLLRAVRLSVRAGNSSRRS